MKANLVSPFPWFGGKSTVAPLIWQALGDVPNYVEPFFGSGAVLFGRPHDAGIETVNDKDGFICNVFRALQHDPEQTAQYADYPAHECDLHARHVWLRERREALTRRLEGDPEYYDAKIAGWWLWGIGLWIGGGWCAEHTIGPWQIVEDEEGCRQLLHLGYAGQGVNRKRLHLASGKGVQRKRLHLASGQGVQRRRLHLARGQGVQRQLLHLGYAGEGVQRQRLDDVYAYFARIQERLRRVRVCCGDWKRILGPSPTTKLALTGVVLDPPYAFAERAEGLYGIEEDVSHAVRDWAIAHGDDPLMRIVLCGYDGEHAMPSSWREIAWKTQGGYAGQGDGRGKDNARRERLWCSPHCLDATKQMDMFA